VVLKTQFGGDAYLLNLLYRLFKFIIVPAYSGILHKTISLQYSGMCHF